MLATIIGVGLALSATAQPGNHPGEPVELNSLPSSVQQTIKQRAASGEIVRIIREDDPDGKWRYEVVARVDGKESGFEVGPDGKVVREHTQGRK